MRRERAKCMGEELKARKKGKKERRKTKGRKREKIQKSMCNISRFRSYLNAFGTAEQLAAVIRSWLREEVSPPPPSLPPPFENVIGWQSFGSVTRE